MMSNEIKRLREALETMYWSGWSDCNSFGYEGCNGDTMVKAKMETMRDLGIRHVSGEDLKPESAYTSRIGPNDLNYPQAPIKGAAPVQWLIDGEWVHKGWLLPQVGE